MLEKFITDKKLGGINCVVWKDGQKVLEKSYGFKNLITREPLELDALFRISSMTKPITSVLAMMLVEEGKWQLQAPITNWFPQFEEMKVVNTRTGKSEPANRQITLLDLLTHRAGFTYSEFQQGKLREDYRKLGSDIDTEFSLKEWVGQLADLPLISQPGEVFNYGRSTDLLGVLVSTIEGKPLGEVMEEKIFAPLAMADTFFDVPEGKKNRCVANFGYDEWGELTQLENVPLNMAMQERPANLEFQSGGQGLWSTLGDYLQFARIFTEAGSPGGTPILSPDTVNLMCTNHLTPDQCGNSTLMGNPIFQEEYGFGLGLAVVSKEGIFGSIPCFGSPGSVGWPGAYGGWWSADRANNSISIFLTHSMTLPSQLEMGIGFELYEAIDVFAKNGLGGE